MVRMDSASSLPAPVNAKDMPMAPNPIRETVRSPSLAVFIFLSLAVVPWSLLLGRNDLVDGGKSVERARVADERQKLSQHGEQGRAVIADVEVARDVTSDLRVGPTERHEHRERQQFPRLQVDA